MSKQNNSSSNGDSNKESKKQQIKVLEKELAAIGGQGVTFIKRLNNAERIGKPDIKLDLLDKFATHVHSPPYSAIVLAGDTLYIAQNKNYADNQLSDNLQKEDSFIKLAKQVDNLKIKIIAFDRNDGDHPDTVAIAAAKKLSKEKKMYLGLAAFDEVDNKAVHNTQIPASCSACGAVIYALREKGYDISVNLSTPTNFPSNSNYTIPKMIINEPDLMDGYLAHINKSLAILQQAVALQNEENLYVQYFSHNKIKNINKDKVFSKYQKKAKINELKERLQEQYQQLKTEKIKSVIVKGNYRGFQKDLKEFHIHLDTAIELTPQLYTEQFVEKTQNHKKELKKQETELYNSLDKELQESIRKNGIQKIIEKQEVEKQKLTNLIIRLSEEIKGNKKANTLHKEQSFKEIEDTISGKNVLIEKYKINLIQKFRETKDDKSTKSSKTSQGKKPLINIKKEKVEKLDEMLLTEEEKKYLQKQEKSDKYLSDVQKDISQLKTKAADAKEKEGKEKGTQKIREEDLANLKDTQTALTKLNKEVSKLNKIKKLQESLREINAILPEKQDKNLEVQPEAQVSKSDQNKSLDTDWYGVENIVNAFKQENIESGQNNKQVEINEYAANNLQGLERILNDRVKNKPDLKLAIILNVDGENGSFGEAGHWTGLYIETNPQGRITTNQYVDPYGNPIDRQIRDTIDRYGNFIDDDDLTKGKPIQYDDNNCGPFVAYLLSKVANKQELPVPLNQEQSSELGQKLRQKFNQKVINEKDISKLGLDNIPIEKPSFIKINTEQATETTAKYTKLNKNIVQPSNNKETPLQKPKEESGIQKSAETVSQFNNLRQNNTSAQPSTTAIIKVNNMRSWFESQETTSNKSFHTSTSKSLDLHKNNKNKKGRG